MVLGIACAAWVMLFTLSVTALLLGNLVGIYVWKVGRRPEQPTWRPHVWIGYLFHPEYYKAEAPHSARKIAAALFVVGAILLITVSVAVGSEYHAGSGGFCGVKF